MTVVSRRSAARKAALLLPLGLIPTTVLVFVAGARWWGPHAGYVLGFVFYWIAWCMVAPLVLLGRRSLLSLFREERPLLHPSNRAAAALLLVIVAITVLMYPPASLRPAPAALLAVAIPIAVVNGICEEMLWRGLYLRVFPGSLPLGVLFPSLGFALWHIAPQLVFPAASGMWTLVASTFFLGLAYAWIAQRNGSILWVATAHSLGGILDLGGFIAPSLLLLLS